MNYEINKCITGHWACPRPHGKYKEIYPPTFLQRLEVLIGPWTDKKILHLFCGSSKFGNCERWACISVGCGPNTRMRTLNIFRKRLNRDE